MIATGTRALRNGFTRTDLLVILASVSLLGALAFSGLVKSRSESRLKLCSTNLKEVARATLAFAADGGKLPGLLQTDKGPSWWWYKDEIRKYTGLSGESSPEDRTFACPLDR